MNDKPVETKEQFEDRLRRADKAHDRRGEWMEYHGKQIESFSIAAMKAPALVAAGGVAAALAFYSANYSRLSAEPSSLEIFNTILFWLFLSLLATVAAPGLAYFSQIAYQSSLSKETYHWELPFVRDTKGSTFYHWLGDFFRWLCVAVVMFSIFCLIVGGVRFLYLVQ